MKIWRKPFYLLSTSMRSCCFVDSHCTTKDIYRLSAALGPVEEPPAAKDNHSPGFKSIVYLANINSLDGTLIRGNFVDKTDGGWHSDQAYRKNPATLSTLFCVIAPESGGSTSFASTRLGYESLPPELKDRLANMKVLYSPGGIAWRPGYRSHPSRCPCKS